MTEEIDTKAKANEFLLCSCTSSKDNLEEYPELKEILPVDFKYTVCHWRKVDADHFECKFRVNVATVEDYDRWVRRFERSSETDFFKDKSLPRFKEAILASLRCDKMTPVNKPAEDAPVKRDVDPSTIKPIVYFEKKCTTRLVMIVKLEGFAKVCDIPDVHLDEFPMTVIYHHLHNHPPVPPRRRSPSPTFVNEEMKLQRQQILAALEEEDRRLQMIACKQAGHDPDEMFKIKYDPFSLTSFYDAISSINRKYEKRNSGGTETGCLLHFGKDSYSKALDAKSLGEWLAVKSRNQFFPEGAASASTSVDDEMPKRTADGKIILDYTPRCSYMYTNTEISEELAKIMDEASLEDVEK